MSISITSDAVEITKLITSMLAALTWPGVVLTIVLVFRSYIAEIIGRASGVEWGSFKVAFERKLESAEENANRIPPSIVAEVGESEDRPAHTEDLPPDYLILEAWRGVERALFELAERAGISSTRGRSPLFLTRALRSRGVLDQQTSALLDDLRGLRNAAVHPEAGPPITREQALRFRDLAELALVQLRSLP